MPNFYKGLYVMHHFTEVQQNPESVLVGSKDDDVGGKPEGFLWGLARQAKGASEGIGGPLHSWPLPPIILFLASSYALDDKDWDKKILKC